MNNVEALNLTNPFVESMKRYDKIYWRNPDFGEKADLNFTQAEIFDAAARWDRFAPYLAEVFPETAKQNGMIESPLLEINDMKHQMEAEFESKIDGSLLLKADSLMPISGSIKSRGGIYEVLKFAETVAMREGDLVYSDDYRVLATPRYRKIFSHYGIAVGSTGNLGLSIGITAATFGFKTTVHMSADARQWKKDKLRDKGVNVVEYNDSFTVAITKGRKIAEKEINTYFIDDEKSRDLFLGYAVAGIRLQKQLKDLDITPSVSHPVFVYLPAGVGGSPSGVSFGLTQIMPEGIYPVFVEPTHVPSVTLGMITGLNSNIAVNDIGLDGKTEADGLAVQRPSQIAGEVMKTLLYASHTFDDEEIYQYLVMLKDSASLWVEPSAAAGFTAILPTIQQLDHPEFLKNATHIVWATGGSMVPEKEMQEYYQHGLKLFK